MKDQEKKSGSKERPGPAEKFLGEIFTEIAGSQYYEAEVNPCEKIQLEREPDNSHDYNAIRVENRNFQQAGYVPRRISSWLAPLVDSGQVWVEGRAAESSGAEKSDRVFILLELYLHRKGRRILRRDTDPKDELEGVHQAVLAIWSAMSEWTNGGTVSAVAKRLKAFRAQELLPETSMLLALFKHRGWTLRRQAGEKAVNDIRKSLKGIKLGKALFYNNLTMFPILSKNGENPDYILLSEAIAKKQAEVREVSESGSIPELLVENRASMPILIPEGEILVGAKQDRTVNVTLLIREKTEHVIPVSCVEQNRWSWRSPTLETSHYATPGLRSRKVASAQAARRTNGRALSDQSRVWEDVAESVSAAGAQSDTGSITDALKTAKKLTCKYREKLDIPKDAAGVLFASGEEILGMDLFDSPKTLSRIWARLSDSYFFEAAIREKRKKTPRSVAAEFIKTLPSIIQPVENSSGHGRELEFSDEGYAGSGLWFNGRICHLAAFRVTQNR